MVNTTSEEVFRGLFARVYIGVNVIKPLKVELQHTHNNVLNYCLIDYEKITNICYGCGIRKH